MNKFDGIPDDHLRAQVDLTQTTYRFPVSDKLGLGSITQTIKQRTYSTTLTESDVLRALLRFAQGVDIENVGERAQHTEAVITRIIDTLKITAAERTEIEQELAARSVAEPNTDPERKPKPTK